MTNERPTWSEAAKEAQLVLLTVSDPVAQRLLYQARVNIQLFKFLSVHLHTEYDVLLEQNYSYAFRSYEREGRWADEQRADSIMLPHERVFGLLIATVTAGHRFIRSVYNAQSKDRCKSWKALSTDISRMRKLFGQTRNFLEHLDEAIDNNETLECSFDCSGVLKCRDGKTSFSFPFDKKSLGRLDKLYIEVIRMLCSRKQE